MQLLYGCRSGTFIRGHDYDPEDKENYNTRRHLVGVFASVSLFYTLCITDFSQQPRLAQARRLSSLQVKGSSCSGANRGPAQRGVQSHTLRHSRDPTRASAFH